MLLTEGDTSKVAARTSAVVVAPLGDRFPIDYVTEGSRDPRNRLHVVFGIHVQQNAEQNQRVP
jgi:hypothetical protein